MASGDLTLTRDGDGHIGIHPYVLALMRWCVSCMWSAANELVHRLITTSAGQITGPRPPPPRAASRGHIHPEPLVRCEVLHQPTSHQVDFVFAHGLYGSLENTWRQGDWRSKYKLVPKTTPLRRSNSIPSPCLYIDTKTKPIDVYQNEKLYDTTYNNQVFLSENYYNETLIDKVDIVDNFEMQAEFVRNLFETECDSSCGDFKTTRDKEEIQNGGYTCECDSCSGVGCGCVCDKCYSSCWPKDWLSVDFPNARIISINYTSDPYLWRPLWKKEFKRLRLQERAEQMTQQLLDLGVGERPIVWVGHSKGGLFIKQIYCEAFESHLKENNRPSTLEPEESFKPTSANNIETNLLDLEKNHINIELETLNDNKTTEPNTINLEEIINTFEDKEIETNKDEKVNSVKVAEDSDINKNIVKTYSDDKRSKLWSNSVAFMFYSVPHRGSLLADIKTPITARSIELLEISKDNDLVLSLQERWLNASTPRAPLVRSLVETNRTLMAILYLTIVTIDSADPGIGALCGISLDHREICKPSSRSCVLYKELINLTHVALARRTNEVASSVSQ